ncbi:hypothetical protein NEA10_13500 [Phormidium yuhuli AB48]|uniref:REase AHJR-like domain-containing protein n=1 Tax=Phormidium yuhuli AB48 TaxID=2940671 RepID=A0ABY5AM17_9CYAN|nr:hypothetical protein [Phormidium yuhuli]USR89872.1 hypothetical protein NEA10_13500 [Phormidium yuhuli AB48]
MDYLSNPERDRELLDLEQDYRHQGYEPVSASEPLQDTLGLTREFVTTYAPDLLLRRGAELIIVKVTSHKDVGSPQLAQLTQEVEQHHNWRLDLLLLAEPPQPQEREPSWQKDEILVRLQTLKPLIEQTPEPAWLYSWALLEATLRLIAEQEEIRLKHRDCAYLIKVMLFEGVLSRPDYQDLHNLLPRRHQLSHGLNTPSIEPDTVRRIVEVIENLWVEFLGNSEGHGAVEMANSSDEAIPIA